MIMAFDTGMFASGLGGLLGGLFGHSDKPFDKAEQAYKQWNTQAQGHQAPYDSAGRAAIPAYQQWLQTQQNPTQFINDTMNQYQESPYARFLQQQSINAGENEASALGLLGSTPMMQQLQQNAHNISSADQNQWLQNVLGINQQYGQGQQNLMNQGQNSANTLSNLANQMGQRMGDAEYNKYATKENNRMNMLSGIGSMFSSWL